MKEISLYIGITVSVIMFIWQFTNLMCHCSNNKHGTLTKEKFDKLCESLINDKWRKTQFDLVREKDGFEIWIANGWAFWRLDQSGIGFTLVQKFKLIKLIKNAASK